jgi:aspartyl-tRNA(Asn)/glutamyl-tRNA(Gln) amidotransferase subunit A
VGDTFGPARNPWDVAREAGGSSSGSGAAVAADLVAGATGSDAAGSIRVPAAFCGVVGLKPTFGTIGRFPGAWNSASTVGPMTKTVRDAAIMLEWMVDPGSRHLYTGLESRLHATVSALTVGVPRRWLDVPMDADVERGYWNVVEWFKDAGATLVDVELPHAEWSQTIGSVITTVEGFAPLQPLLAQGASIGTYVRQTILTSQLITANDMLLAKAARRLLIDEMTHVHRTADLIITPSVPYPAYRFDETELNLVRGTVNARANLTVFGRMANLTGFPAVSVPCGFTGAGLPLAFQLMGRPYEEGLLLGAAATYEDATVWHDRRARSKLG